MSIPAKGSRKIAVDGVVYRWMATGNDLVIDVIVEKEESKGQKLVTRFDYHDMQRHGQLVPQRRKVTPVLVEMVIRKALDKGWRPDAAGVPNFFVEGEEIAPLVDDPDGEL